MRSSAPGRQSHRAVWAVLLCLGAGLPGGCANGDFGRVKPTLVADDIHAWVGEAAVAAEGIPASEYPLTDDERLLRDLAYPLIEPPYDRHRWFSIIGEYGLMRVFRRDWGKFDDRTYAKVLMSEDVRSESSRYARLNDDIRNDRVRIPPFFLLAQRVIEADRQRELRLSAAALSKKEYRNAMSRIAENRLVVGWVQRSLGARSASYAWAIERLEIAAPMPEGLEAERSLVAMRELLASYQILPAAEVVRVLG